MVAVFRTAFLLYHQVPFLQDLDLNQDPDPYLSSYPPFAMEVADPFLNCPSSGRKCLAVACWWVPFQTRWNRVVCLPLFPPVRPPFLLAVRSSSPSQWFAMTCDKTVEQRRALQSPSSQISRKARALHREGWTRNRCRDMQWSTPSHRVWRRSGEVHQLI